MATNDGGPAFPRQTYQIPTNQEFEWGNEGMSLRDWFAGRAMQSLIVNDKWDERANSEGGVARIAYILADAMLKEREK